MRLSIAVATVLVAQICSIAGIAPDSRPTVKLCVEVGTPDPRVIPRGESIATEIFAQIGIKLDWVHRAHCPEASLAERTTQLDVAGVCGACEDFHTPGAVRSGGGIVILIGAGPRAEVHPGALAYARLGEARVEVFFDRVSTVVDRLVVPSLLGHVLAHEIAHLLEGVDRHSHEGIMKAHWTSHEYEQMYPGPMRFAPEDVVLIRAAVLGN